MHQLGVPGERLGGQAGEDPATSGGMCLMASPMTSGSPSYIIRPKISGICSGSTPAAPAATISPHSAAVTYRAISGTACSSSAVRCSPSRLLAGPRSSASAAPRAGSAVSCQSWSPAVTSSMTLSSSPCCASIAATTDAAPAGARLATRGHR